MDGKFLQDYSVNAGVSQASISGPILFLLCIIDLRDDFTFNSGIYAGKTTLYSKCDKAFDL